MKLVGIPVAEGRPRLLVVEPNRDYSRVVVRRLADCGYRVVTAENAEGGLAELYRIPADLVLCELNLPGTTGVEFVRRIRDDVMHRDVPVLLIAGQSDDAGAVQAYHSGADGVVRKPFHFEVLVACIAREIERATARRHLVDANAALDARAISRAIELRDVRERLSALEEEARRLEAIVRARAA